MSKENIPPNSHSQREASLVKQSTDASYGLSLPLGEEYERKKHKLKEELRRDYRKYLSQKQLAGTGELDPATHGMSLPIGERLSAKERLRLERNREYNQFLRLKTEGEEGYQLALVSSKDYTQHDKAQNRAKHEQYSEAPVTHRDHGLPKKDAYTSMEAYEQLLSKRRAEAERLNRRVQPETEVQVVYRAEEDKKPRRSEMDPDVIDRPRQSAVDYEVERRPMRFTVAPDNEPVYLRGRHDEDVVERRPVRYKLAPERAPPRRGEALESYDYRPDQTSYLQVERADHRDRRDRETPVVYEDDFREPSNRRPLTSLTRSRPKADIPMQPTERSKSANIKEETFSTGLLLGGSDKDEAQKRRKERYRQELMEQMAEQQRNKRREKELELKVAATGAIDPEKQPDRLRQFGAINRQQDMPYRNVPYRPGVLIDSEKTGRRAETKPVIEEKVPPERPRVAFQAPVPDPTITGNAYPGVINPGHEEFHRGISNVLGEIVAPRISAVPPPQPPVLVDNYRTPYDDAYYYYGARNPLDPNLAYYPVAMTGMPPAPGIPMPVSFTSQLHPGEPTVDSKQRPGAAKGASLGSFPEEKPRQNRQAAQSYQEELERQIREKNEKRRHDKEEHERYDAKLEAEMKYYNPWGKGGGGAPLKDSKGNLITDLKRMHNKNEVAYQNPELKALEDQRALVAMEMNLAESSTAPGKIAGFSLANAPQFARGTMFNEPPSEQQVQQQESYKDFLRQQIEEKRRKEAEERDRIRLEEEREEKRLADQRAKIQREYEEEQNKKKLKDEEQRQKNEELIRLADERRKEAERKRKEEEAKQEEELRRFYEQQKGAPVTEAREKTPRPPSPVIPTLQAKASSRTHRPPTAESEVSIQSHDVTQSRAASPPVPARRNQIRAYDEKKSVINELSELRKQLRSEQKRLEGRLQDTEGDDESLPSRSGRRREKNSADVFDLARQKLQATVRRPSLKGLESVNMQNIRDFNDLKYRDTDTREGVRFMYPDPPKDNQTLEIQQQALLREQQRHLNRMKRRPPMPNEFEPMPTYSLRHTGVLKDPSKDLLKTSLLESESAFIGENGEPYPTFIEPVLDLQTTARERRRYKQQPLDFENEIPPVPPLPLNQPDSYSINSASSLNVEELQSKNEERLRRLNILQKSTVSIDDDPEGFGNAEDILKHLPRKQSARPQSVDTVATEPWMRPGTSETLKRFMAGQMNQSKPSSDNALPFNWQGLSTAHG
ncbi:centrosome and spindle pole-associated protein 1 isoform X2 [Hyperolius riggenbachi]|uniref:centrosome and spindle pole-associated protein 1 isoform X2 n=1 Tax=Hyperolius riggenbachi TaxID=752182 RepID=UPI0035A2AAD2